MELRGPRAIRVAAAVSSVALIVAGAVVVPSASAQECAGTVTTSVASEAIPGGEWSVTDGCLPAETYFEYDDGPVHAEVAVSTVVYDDGHTGRVATGVLTLGTGVGLSLVGVEDASTGFVKWSAVLGDYSATGDTVTVSGSGVSLFPTQPAELSVSLSGTGTDITTILGAGIDQNGDVGPPPSIPGATTVPPTTAVPPSTTVPPTTVAPGPAPGSVDGDGLSDAPTGTNTTVPVTTTTVVSELPDVGQ